MTTVAIHQPNFLPWLGYFSKIAAVETFLFFDAVALSNGKSWTSRTQILVNGNPQWLSVPIVRSGRTQQRIYEVELLDFTRNWHKMLQSIRHAYHRTAYFKEIFPFLEGLDISPFALLADFNIFFIELVSRQLGCQTVFQRASSKPQLLETDALKTDCIIDTCKAFDVTHYLAGKGGSLLFLELEKFKEAAIQIDFHSFTPCKYPQYNTNTFVNGLSIIDVLMNCGWKQTAKMIQFELSMKAF
jgi:WbqC-like protein family